MSKYFDGYASWGWNEMSKDKLLLELKKKCKYVAELKQQLAEKNKEIEKLNACVKFYKSYYISFNEKVINELEKVKEYFIEGYAVCKSFSDFYWNFTEQIDNQIEALTHQHEDRGENK